MLSPIWARKSSLQKEAEIPDACDSDPVNVVSSIY